MKQVTQRESIVLLYLVVFIREIENLEDAINFLDQGKEVDLKLNSVNKADIEAVKIYLSKGLSPLEIAEKMEIHYQTVYKILRIINKE